MSILSRLAELLADRETSLLNPADETSGAPDASVAREVLWALPHDFAALSPEQVHEIGTILGRHD